jgi:hypothetical protein
MTEKEWLETGDPLSLLLHLGLMKPSPLSMRKLRLSACAFVAHIKDYLKDKRSLDALETAERFADGLSSEKEMRTAGRRAKAAYDTVFIHDQEASAGSFTRPLGAHAANLLAYIPHAEGELQKWRKRASDISLSVTYAAVEAGVDELVRLNVRMNQRNIIQDIFGNPFRPVTLNPSWLTSTVLALANGIYSEKAFDRMPILADALQDAGCDNEDILNHCRQAGEHCRGCFVVDLLLQKE